MGRTMVYDQVVNDNDKIFFIVLFPAILFVSLVLLVTGHILTRATDFILLNNKLFFDYPYIMGLLFFVFANLFAWEITHKPSWGSAHRYTVIGIFAAYMFNPTKIHFTLPLFGLFFLYKIIKEGGRVQIHWSPSHWILITVYFFWIFSNYTFTKYLGFYSVNNGIQFTSRVMDSVFFLSFFHKKKDLEFILKVFLLFSFISSLIGSAQFISYELTGYTKTFSDLNSKWAFINGRRYIRPTGLANHPSVFGFINELSSLGCFYYSMMFLNESDKKKKRTFYKIAGLYFGVEAFLSFSRATWLGWTAGVIMLFMLKYNRHLVRIILIIGLILIIMLLTGVLQAIVQFIIDINKTSFDFRIHQFHYAFEVIFQRPITGLGSGQYVIAPGNVEKLHVHDTLLEVLTEGGLLTALPYLLLLGVVMYRGITRYFMSKTHYAQYYLGMITLLYCAAFVDHIGQQGFYNSLPYSMIGLIEAMIYVIEHGENTSREIIST